MQSNYSRFVLNGAIACLALALGACSGGSDEAKLTLGVTDAPVDDATSVVVEFTGVELKPVNDAPVSFDFDEPKTIDLLALAGGGSELLLDGVTVPAGGYNWLRLKVNAAEDSVLDSYLVTSDGGQHELEIPSGAESGLKLNRGFLVPSGGHAQFTIDFDLRKSVHQPMDEADSYKLRPTLRIVDNAQIGRIAGSVAAALVTTDCAPAVYIFEGASVTPDDVDEAAPEPITTGIPQLNSGTGNYDYQAAFLSPGDYTVAFTCDAGADDPAASNTLVFAPARNATVTDGQTTTVNFAP